MKPQRQHHMWTYLVGWDDALIIKVGVTMNRRWRTFVNRGATLHMLHLADQGAPPQTICDLESDVERWLGRNLPGAFATKPSSAGYLGPSGGGYMECYQAGSGRVYQDALATCAGIMLRHSGGQCGIDERALMHGRTDVRTHGEPHSPTRPPLVSDADAHIRQGAVDKSVRSA